MKGRMNKFAKVIEFKAGDNKKYKVEAIQDSAAYAKETDRHLTGLYYLLTWKGYPENKNTWEPFSTIIHPRNIVNTF